MSLAQFSFISFGGSGPKVRISDLSVTDNDFANAYAEYKLENDGDIISTTNFAGAVDEGDWIIPKSAAGAAYEVRATVNLGSVSGGSSATGAWLALSTTRAWNCAQVGTGTQTVVLTIEIRLAASGTVLSTATVTITADVL